MPVLIWSPSRGRALAAAARAAGWPAEARDRAPEEPGLLVVDGREAGADDVLARAAAPVLALTDDGAAAIFDRLYDLGATQVAVIDADGGGFVQALRFAERAMAAARPRDRRAPRRGPVGVLDWVEERLATTADPLTVIQITLLRLDLVNAAHGRDGATALLAAVERRIAAQVMALADDEGRVGRDGSRIVAAIAGPSQRAILAAARIDEALSRGFRVNGTAMVVGSRLALASRRPMESAAALLARAVDDTAQDHAPCMDLADEGPAIGALAVDLHHAFARNEISLRYQPQARLADGAWVGVEALARWDHPQHGALGAATLFAAAGCAGLDLALSEHILHHALAAAALWPAALARLRLSINLTAADLLRPGFGETLMATIDASGFPRERLTLEITETGLMADLDLAAALLAVLRGAGCRIAIDDFGTGYSSLAYLKSLPIDYLKIDKSLAQDIDGTLRDQVVVRGAIEMAHSLGITVIVEGVETTAQRDELAAAGCAIYQGFLLAEPLDEAALIATMAARP